MDPVRLAQSIPASETKVTQERMTPCELRRTIIMPAIALGMLYVFSKMVFGYNGYGK